MTRLRILGLVFSLILLFVAAPTFADKDKSDSKGSKKESPAKTSSHSPSSENSGHHGSSSGSHSSSATSTSPKDSASSYTHSDPHDSNATGSSRETRERTENRRIVDHVQLHERLLVRPNTVDRQHAYAQSRVERAQFQQHIGPIHFVAAHRAVLVGIRIVPTTYYYRRTVFYDAYGWRAPVYVYGLYPRYGLWDAVFLAFALDHIAEEQYALMFYNHRHDPEIEQWMADNDRLAAENDDLRARLEDMKLKVDSYEQSGVATNAAYVPPEAQDVALSPEVIAQLTSK
jgi:hypothetical protein